MEVMDVLVDILEVVTTFVMPFLKFLISPFIKLARWTGDIIFPELPETYEIIDEKLTDGF